VTSVTSTKETADLWRSIPGGPALLAFFGAVPSFHDSEVLDLNLSRSAQSTLRLHFWRGLIPAEGHAPNVLRPADEVIVAFRFEEITDLKLDGFSHQNVVGGLILRRVRAEISDFGMTRITLPPAGPDLFEIEMEPIYGISGRIRARKVSVSFTPGGPMDTAPEGDARSA
jgi:hypothetical protein